MGKHTLLFNSERLMNFTEFMFYNPSFEIFLFISDEIVFVDIFQNVFQKIPHPPIVNFFQSQRTKVRLSVYTNCCYLQLPITKFLNVGMVWVIVSQSIDEH